MEYTNLLLSKKHNPHFLNRYIKFVSHFKESNLEKSCYYEKHHICPKAYWPQYKNTNKHPWNKVLLTARQHFIAHWLLAKSFGGSMWYALHMMSIKTNLQGREINLTSRQYSIIKQELSDYNTQKMSGERNHRRGVPLTKEHKDKLSKIFSGKGNPFYNKHHSQETKDKISQKNKGKLSKDKNPMFGKKGELCPSYGLIRSEETIQKMKEARSKSLKIVTCPHCKKQGELRAMKRWHFNNCKYK